MTPIEMAMNAAKCLGAGATHMTLTLPAKARLIGFPRGELLSVNPENGARNCRYDATRVLAWLLAKGLVTMERQEDNTLVVRAGKETSHATPA